MKNSKSKIDERKIAIYSRKSKFTGKGESTHNQIEACKVKIRSVFGDMNFKKDILIYEDEGFTGYNTNRPGFQKMVKDIKEGKIKAIVFYKIDRVSRNVSDFSSLVTMLDNYDVSFFSATESLDNYTPSGVAMTLMISVFAQLERDTIAERIRDNMHELAKTGRWLGGNTPTGFKSEKIESISVDGKKKSLHKLSPIEDEIRMVKLLYAKMKELGSQTKLETYTLENDIKTKQGRIFTRWGLKNILTNPVYAVADEHTLRYCKECGMNVFGDEKDFDGVHGLMVFNKTEKKGKRLIQKDYCEWIVAVGKHEGVIPGKEWVEVQNLIERNSNMRYRKQSVTNCLLSGLLRCEHCGSLMRGKTVRKDVDKFGRRKFNYMCELKEHSRSKKCKCKNINGRETDDLVVAEIKKLAAPTSEFYKALKKLSTGMFNEEDKNNDEIKALKAMIRKNENDISALLDRVKLVDVDLIDDVSKEIKKLKKANEKLEKQIMELTDYSYQEIKDKDTADLVLHVLDTYFESFDDLDLFVKRNLIKLLVGSITSDGENVTINFLGARTCDDDFFPTGECGK